MTVETELWCRVQMDGPSHIYHHQQYNVLLNMILHDFQTG